MRLPKNATAEFLHLSPLRVCSVACVLSGWWGSSGVLFRVDWELDAVSVGSGCSSSHYGQMPLSPSMGIWRATAATRHQTVRVPLPPEEEKWGREGQGGGEGAGHSGMVGGLEREGQGGSGGRGAVGILMLKWFDTLGIIASRAMGGGRGSPTERLIRMSPKPISWSGRSET